MTDHWRRQLRGSGARAPSTSSCLIFLVTSEPHILFDIRLHVVAHAVKTYRPLLLFLHEFHNIFVSP